MHVFCLALGLAAAAWSRPRPAAPSPRGRWRLALAGLALLQAGWHLASLWRLYLRFETGGIDLATISQGLWKISLGQAPFETILQTHSLRVHFSPIWWLLAPVLRLAESVPLLLGLSVLSVAGAALFLYPLVRRLSGSEDLGAAFACSYLLCAYTGYGQMAALHADNFSVFFLSGFLWALFSGRKLWAALLGLLALACKEDVGLLLALAALAWGWSRGRWPAALLLACSAAAWSALALGWWMPAFGPDTQRLGDRYASLFGSGALAFPVQVLKSLAQWEKIFAASYLLLQCGGLGLLAGPWALPLGGGILMRSLSEHPGMSNFWDHYSLHLLPFLFLASALGLQRLRRVALAGWPAPGLALGLLLASLALHVELGRDPLGRHFDPQALRLRPHDYAGARAAACIPPRAELLTQELLAPHFPFRPTLLAASGVSAPLRQAALATPAEWVLLDLAPPRADPCARELAGLAARLDRDPNCVLRFSQDGWRVYQRLGRRA